jgi:hypothetical protein
MWHSSTYRVLRADDASKLWCSGAIPPEDSACAEVLSGFAGEGGAGATVAQLKVG